MLTTARQPRLGSSVHPGLSSLPQTSALPPLPLLFPFSFRAAGSTAVGRLSFPWRPDSSLRSHIRSAGLGAGSDLFRPNRFRPARSTCLGQYRFGPIPLQASTASGQIDLFRPMPLQANVSAEGWAPNCGAPKGGGPNVEKVGGP